MLNIKHVLFIALAFFCASQSAFAIKKGEKINYSITVNNKTEHQITANGVVIHPSQTNIIIGNYVDTAKSSELKVEHAATILDSNNADICVVTGHIDFSAHGMSMYAENNNTERCTKSNGMSNSNYGLTVTVVK